MCFRQTIEGKQKTKKIIKFYSDCGLFACGVVILITLIIAMVFGNGKTIINVNSIGEGSTEIILVGIMLIGRLLQ